MIDLDRLDDQLERALAQNLRTTAERSAPAGRRRPPLPAAAGADPPTAVAGPVAAVAPGPELRHLPHRFRLLLEGGDEDERYRLLDECRERAYTHGDVRWRAALTLLLARLGRTDEARRELDATVADADALPHDGTWLEIVTDLADAATILGDAERSRLVRRRIPRVPDRMLLTASSAPSASA